MMFKMHVLLWVEVSLYKSMYSVCTINMCHAITTFGLATRWKCINIQPVIVKWIYQARQWQIWF